MKIAPSATRTFYEMIINTGPDDYRVTLTPAMLGDLLRSARDALQGTVPSVEERAATQLPMNEGNMLLVRLNPEGLLHYKPENLYLQIFKAWKEGFFQKYGVGTAQQAIRKEAIKDRRNWYHRDPLDPKKEGGVSHAASSCSHREIY